mmetsp:Transcript_56549/g.134374  ORF Transcript_56549/g.134374 Transcript_56549/m.134374 type:complete len:278 (-) Transcript_56549:26-859(-)
MPHGLRKLRNISALSLEPGAPDIRKISCSGHAMLRDQRSQSPSGRCISQMLVSQRDISRSEPGDGLSTVWRRCLPTRRRPSPTMPWGDTGSTRRRKNRKKRRVALGRGAIVADLVSRGEVRGRVKVVVTMGGWSSVGLLAVEEPTGKKEKVSIRASMHQQRERTTRTASSLHVSAAAIHALARPTGCARQPRRPTVTRPTPLSDEIRAGHSCAAGHRPSFGIQAGAPTGRHNSSGRVPGRGAKKGASPTPPAGSRGLLALLSRLAAATARPRAFRAT